MGSPLLCAKELDQLLSPACLDIRGDGHAAALRGQLALAGGRHARWPTGTTGGHAAAPTLHALLFLQRGDGSRVTRRCH